MPKIEKIISLKPICFVFEFQVSIDLDLLNQQHNLIIVANLDEDSDVLIHRTIKYPLDSELRFKAYFLSLSCRLPTLADPESKEERRPLCHQLKISSKYLGSFPHLSQEELEGTSCCYVIALFIS